MLPKYIKLEIFYFLDIDFLCHQICFVNKQQQKLVLNSNFIQSKQIVFQYGKLKEFLEEKAKKALQNKNCTLKMIDYSKIFKFQLFNYINIKIDQFQLSLVQEILFLELLKTERKIKVDIELVVFDRDQDERYRENCKQLINKLFSLTNNQKISMNYCYISQIILSQQDLEKIAERFDKVKIYGANLFNDFNYECPRIDFRISKLEIFMYQPFLSLKHDNQNFSKMFANINSLTFSLISEICSLDQIADFICSLRKLEVLELKWDSKVSQVLQKVISLLKLNTLISLKIVQFNLARKLQESQLCQVLRITKQYLQNNPNQSFQLEFYERCCSYSIIEILKNINTLGLRNLEVRLMIKITELELTEKQIREIKNDLEMEYDDQVLINMITNFVKNRLSIQIQIEKNINWSYQSQIKLIYQDEQDSNKIYFEMENYFLE